MLHNNEDPIERKVQLTGGSTYTVSLPKEWAGEQGIEPGCLVDLYSQEDQLVLTRNRSGLDSGRHVTTIQAGNRDPAALALSVAAAYTAGCDEIRIEDIHSSDQRRAITRTIRGFVGLEVMTEDRDSLVTRTMLNVNDLSPEQTLRQIERTTLAMHERAIEAVVDADGETGGEIVGQDDDVDRLFALVSRGFQQSLVDPAATMGDDGLTAFEYYMAARQLERIADHAEKIATIAGRLDDPPPEDVADDLVDLGIRARALVRQALDGLLNEPAELRTVIRDVDPLLGDIESIDEQLYERGLDEGYHLGLVVDSIERTIHYGVNVTEAGLQARYRG